MILFTLVSILAHTSSAPAEDGGSPTPMLGCAIKMRTWCIAGVDGTVQLSDDGRYRRWSIADRLYMRNGPLIIIESKSCDAVERATPRRLDERRLPAQGGSDYISVRYSLSQEDACLLEFWMPTNNGALDPIYRHFTLYNVFINDRQLASLTE